MDLIPSLPDSVARECLLRVSYRQFPLIASVCKSWNREINLPDYFPHRKLSGHSQELLVFSQALLDKPGSGHQIGTPVYRIVVLEPESGLWTELPHIPGQKRGVPLFCRLAAVGSDLVVLGGLDPLTWQTSDSVFLFSFLTSTWRVGRSMPGGPRSFFGCASDSLRNIYVAGGHDEDKNALTSALVYDVPKDEWAFLPLMERERDECTLIFHAGRVHVIGGYATEEQGEFSKSAEIFDVVTWKWGPLINNFLYSGITTRYPPICAAAGGDDGELYACCGGDLMVMKGDTWQHVGNLPAESYNVSYVAVRRSGKLVVLGSARYGEPTVGYEWDTRNSRWTKMERQDQYVGHVQAACYLHL